jgi:hypothetical protein
MRSAAQTASEVPLATRTGAKKGWGAGYTITPEELEKAKREGASVAPFNYVVVAIDSTGALLGFDAKLGTEKNIHYAVSKAACAMLLASAGRSGHVMVRDNLEYLESLGLKRDVNVFLGGVEPRKIGEKTVYFAGGSCLLNEEIVNDIQKVIGRKPQKFDWAGISEEDIARLTSIIMADPNFDKDAPYESPLLQEVYSMSKEELVENLALYS